MIVRSLLFAGLLALASAASPAPASAQEIEAPEPSRDHDVLTGALKAELDRAMNELELPGEERPYLVIYDVVEGRHTTAFAEFGAMLQDDEIPYRQLRVEVRTGDYQFDSSNFDALGEGDGVVISGLPLADDEIAIRRRAWAATDRAYKHAVEQLSRKEAEITDREDDDPPDLLQVPPVVTPPAAPLPMDGVLIREAVTSLSGVLADDPDLESGTAAGRDWQGRRVTISSEGMDYSQPTGFAVVRVEGVLRLEDGTRLRDGRWWVARTAAELPPLDEMIAETRALADWLVALQDAPVLDDYIGPVIFEAPASVELYRQLAAAELVGTPPMRQARGGFGDMGSSPRAHARVGRRLLPEGWTIVDDPTLPDTAGRYLYDHEGVPGQRVELVEDGVVRRLLTSRVPASADATSTGHARSMGSWRREALPSAVQITPKRSRSDKRMRRKALRLARSAGRDDVLVVRLLEPPAMTEDFDVYFTGEGPPPGLTPPYEAYLLGTDGSETPVRGAAFIGVDRRVLRDVLIAGEPGPMVGVLDNAPGPRRFSVGAVGGMPAAWSAPPVLITELELEGKSGGARREIPPPER